MRKFNLPIVSPNASENSDLYLIEQLRSGNADAFSAIYRQYYKPLFRWTYNVLRDREICEDVLHDVFLNFWERRESIHINTSLKAFLYAAVRYQVLNRIRHGKVRDAVYENLELRIWGMQTPENILHQKELQASLREIIDSLPGRTKEVYLMSREEGLTYREIAERLSLSVKTVEFHMSEALKRIRSSFGKMLAFLLLLIS